MNHDILVIELQNPDDFQTQLHQAFQHKELKSLTINLEANAGWIMYPTGPAEMGTEPVYEFTYKVGGLPDELAGMDSLENFSVSFIGLDSLPQSITQLSALRRLNISFNKIDFEKEMEKLVKLNHLEVLVAYGCGVREEHLLQLHISNPSLKVLHTGQQFTDSFKKDFKGTLK